jgi:acyl-[acyl-carrier-protein]-phospholipid O-acyltransferase/long-chain-fatty-acid--[acyl-carrier-protein] ligase
MLSGLRANAIQRRSLKTLEPRRPARLLLPQLMLRQCRRSLFRSKVADSTGADLSGGALLLRALVLRRVLAREVLAADEKFVAVLLPPSAAAVVVNACLTLMGRISVNLNYTASSAVIKSCLDQCGIRHVLTSRKVMDKLKLKLDARLVYLEDFQPRIKLSDKLAAAALAYLTPVVMLERMLGLTRLRHDDVMTVIFTSGSTGDPKGVMLSFENIGSNVEAIDQIIQLKKSDVLLGILPFFHSFGYTVTVWTVLTLALKGAYHFSPLDAHLVGKLTREQHGTILIGTPTFLRSYLRRCPPEDFASLEVVVAGAEKQPKELSDAFEERFGVRPVEGYGATECSPLVAANIPASRAPNTSQVVSKEGTVGRAVPGVLARITDLDSGKPLGFGQAGMLWIRGPNVMQGYLNKPDVTAKVLVDGWYMTGDVAMLDADGFITITGRESRFSKIGGEMVPHMKIEETLAGLVGGDGDEVRVAVTAVPDERKGERLVVVHTALEKRPEQLVKELAAAGLPNLWIPAVESFLQVDAIPVLGTGKLDLKAVKQVALERFGGVRHQ